MENIKHIGRIVLQGSPDNWPGRESLLFETLSYRWPSGLHIKFLITSGGFNKETAFPSLWNGGLGWQSTTNDLNLLIPDAEKALRSQILTPRVRESAKKKIDVITIGVDLGGNPPSKHAELVAVYEVSSGQTRWTGKSYPTGDQENSLVHVIDINTHLLNLADERVLVLGCHDLNIFSKRSQANSTKISRKQRSRCFRELIRIFDPTVILHHPHRTDTSKTWQHAWSQINRELHSIKAYASAIAYYHLNNDQLCEPRMGLNELLNKTQGGLPCEDFVIP
jgi:hypothetical protein